MTPSTNSTRRAARHGLFPRALACAETAPGYPADPALRVDRPGELIAALPALLGFVPERSLVIAVTTRSRTGTRSEIESVVRFDLDAVEEPRHLDQLIDCVDSIATHEHDARVYAIFVDDRAPATGAAVALTAFDAAAIPVRGAWFVPAVAAGERWRSLFDPGAEGLVADPAASPIALSRVIGGRQIRRSREELVDPVRADRQLCARVHPRIEAAVTRYRDGLTAATEAGQARTYQRGALEWVLWQIADVASGAPRAARELARLAAILRDRSIRDALYGLALGDHAEAAEQLWAQLARATPGADRAEAAALLGFSAYVRGDGPFAGIALAAAVEADPTHSMAVLLETSLQSGLRPERLRDLVRCGHEIAADLGVDLGPMAP